MPYDLSLMEEELLLALDRGDQVEASDDAAIAIYHELGSAGLVRVSELFESMDGERRRYAFAVVMLEAGDQAVREIKRLRGVPLDPSSTIPGPEDFERARAKRSEHGHDGVH